MAHSWSGWSHIQSGEKDTHHKTTRIKTGESTSQIVMHLPRHRHKTYHTRHMISQLPLLCATPFHPNDGIYPLLIDDQNYDKSNQMNARSAATSMVEQSLWSKQPSYLISEGVHVHAAQSRSPKQTKSAQSIPENQTYTGLDSFLDANLSWWPNNLRICNALSAYNQDLWSTYCLNAHTQPVVAYRWQSSDLLLAATYCAWLFVA
jgi:hypothetical protein